MGFGRKISYFFKNIRKKFRLSLRDQHTESEVWYMHISPLELIGGSLALLLVLFILILTIVDYTPVLNLIPGYSGNKQREAMIQNIMRVDSIERQLNELIAYTDDMTLIKSGKTPVIRNVTQAGASLAAVKV